MERGETFLIPLLFGQPPQPRFQAEGLPLTVKVLPVPGAIAWIKALVLDGGPADRCGITVDDGDGAILTPTATEKRENCVRYSFAEHRILLDPAGPAAFAFLLVPEPEAEDAPPDWRICQAEVEIMMLLEQGSAERDQARRARLGELFELPAPPSTVDENRIRWRMIKGYSHRPQRTLTLSDEEGATLVLAIRLLASANPMANASAAKHRAIARRLLGQIDGMAVPLREAPPPWEVSATIAREAERQRQESVPRLVEDLRRLNGVQLRMVLDQAAIAWRWRGYDDVAEVEREEGEDWETWARRCEQLELRYLAGTLVAEIFAPGQDDQGTEEQRGWHYIVHHHQVEPSDPPPGTWLDGFEEGPLEALGNAEGGAADTGWRLPWHGADKSTAWTRPLAAERVVVDRSDAKVAPTGVFPDTFAGRLQAALEDLEEAAKDKADDEESYAELTPDERRFRADMHRRDARLFRFIRAAVKSAAREPQ